MREKLLTRSLVDGGHRAIKYTRIGGVQTQIYNEGIADILPLPLCLADVS